MLPTTLRISLTDRIINAEVLQRVNRDCEVITIIKRRKHQYLGHIMSGEKYSPLINIMQGKIKVKRSARRRNTSWMRNLNGNGSATAPVKSS